MKGFTEQTAKLTDKEQKEIVPFIVDLLKTRTGSANAITGNRIIKYYETRTGEKIGAPRVRKCINFIRREALIDGVLCATSAGYFLAGTKKEAEDYLGSIKERAEAVKEVANVTGKAYLYHFGNKLF